MPDRASIDLGHRFAGIDPVGIEPWVSNVASFFDRRLARVIEIQLKVG
jgi:hypothetical protein